MVNLLLIIFIFAKISMVHSAEFLGSLNFSLYENKGLYTSWKHKNLSVEYRVFFALKKVISLEQIIQLRNELLEARKSGRQVFHLWEDIYLQNPDLIQATISARLGNLNTIHARDLTLLPVENDIAYEFLSKHHILGFSPAKEFIALAYSPHRHFRYQGPFMAYKDYRIVGMAGFGRTITLKKDGKSSQELIRFASVAGSQIIGGWSKLLKFHLRSKNIQDIMTYVDLEWNDAKGLFGLGFQLDSLSSPLFFQSINQKRIKTEDCNQADFFNLGNYKLRLNV